MKTIPFLIVTAAVVAVAIIAFIRMRHSTASATVRDMSKDIQRGVRDTVNTTKDAVEDSKDAAKDAAK